MAEKEPTLPMPLPVSAAPRTWGQRVKAVFTEPVKLPGWAAVLFVGLQVIPDWKSRFDFWLDVAKQTGGYIALAATVIASPYFTPSLLAAGLAWIIFAGESPKGVQRHHWLRYVGWSIFLICFTTIVVTAAYGAIEFYIKEQVSKRDTEIQRQSAIRPVFWHLTDFERSSLGRALDQVPKDQRFEIKIMCLPDAGSRTYVEDLAKVLTDHTWKLSANCLFSDVRPDLVGLYVGISPSLKEKKFEEYPKNLQLLVKILTDAKINAQWATTKEGTKEDDFYLVVGNAP